MDWCVRATAPARLRLSSAAQSYCCAKLQFLVSILLTIRRHAGRDRHCSDCSRDARNLGVSLRREMHKNTRVAAQNGHCVWNDSHRRGGSAVLDCVIESNLSAMAGRQAKILNDLQTHYFSPNSLAADIHCAIASLDCLLSNLDSGPQKYPSSTGAWLWMGPGRLPPQSRWRTELLKRSTVGSSRCIRSCAARSTPGSASLEAKDL